MKPAEKTTSICSSCGHVFELSAEEFGCPVCLLQLGTGDDGDSEEAETEEAVPDEFGTYAIARNEEGRACELGRGAMGVTYRAIDTSLNREVALKIIRAGIGLSNAEARERFAREARAAAALRHPNVATVYQFGIREETGQCFCAMELIEGETLEDRVRRTGPLKIDSILEIAHQITAALTEAEKRGLVHRDLKPANIMVQSLEPEARPEKLTVKIIDFGIAKALAETPDARVLTNNGFIGTPAFASPEQFDDRSVDGRSDIYSLGATLWFLLTGHILFGDRDGTRRGALPIDQLKAAHVPSLVIPLLTSMLASEPAARPSVHDLAKNLEAIQRQLADPGKRLRRGLAMTAAVVVLAAGATYLISRSFAPRPSSSRSDVSIKSIAVLPFENLSDDKDNAFFADGIQDDVLTSLAKIRDLKVIGRASVMGYRGATGAEKLREIGHALDVRNLLEGSVRRDGERITISARLLDPRDGHQLWGETYNRTPRDVLSLQGELAREIAIQLHATISPEERARLERPPTENADAYALYLRALNFSRLPTSEDGATAVRLLEQAVTLDPTFAAAWGQLAVSRAGLYQRDRTEERKAATFSAAREALRLRPDQPEAHRALGAYYFVNRDFSAALEECNLLLATLPNDSRTIMNVANLKSRQGRWQEARAGFERAAALSPQEFRNWYNLSICASNQRDWPALARAQDRVLALAPDVVSYRIERARTEFYWKGDLAPLKAVLAAIPPGDDPGHETVVWGYQLAMWVRDYTAAEAILTNFPGDSFQDIPKCFPLGELYQTLNRPGDAARAETCLQAAREIFEKSVQKDPGEAIHHAHLGMVYADLGWRDAAVGEVAYAMTLSPESKDATDGPIIAAKAAQTYAFLGEADLALPIIEHLLAIPTRALNIQLLRFDSVWDNVRGDRRFAAIGERAGVPFPPWPNRASSDPR